MSAKVTEEELAIIEARAKAATEGPWTIELGEETSLAIYRETWRDRSKHGKPLKHHVQELWPVNSEADIEFIKHAREDIPRLIAEIRRLRGG